MHERFARGVLGIDALAFLALGLWLFAQPEGLSAVGLAADNPAARIELRATYGGVELGLGAFLAWTAWGPRSRLRVGLVASVLTLGGFGAGRALGMLADWPPPGVFWGLLAVEILCVAAGIAAWWGLREPARITAN